MSDIAITFYPETPVSHLEEYRADLCRDINQARVWALYFSRYGVIKPASYWIAWAIKRMKLRNFVDAEIENRR